MKTGIFDSGMGGLFVMKTLHNKFPENQFIYYGDTAHLPYGTKEIFQLKSYAKNIINFLKSQQADLIIVACNTISATLLPEVRKMATPLPLFDVLTPTVKETVSLAREKNARNILIIGTPTMIQSKTYFRKISEALPEANIKDFATPEFVPLIEAGKTNTPEMQRLLEKYFTPYPEAELIVLGCTHYEALTENLTAFYQKNFGHIPLLVSSARSISRELPKLTPSKNAVEIYSSAFSEDFDKLARAYFSGATILVKNVHSFEDNVLQR